MKEFSFLTSLQYLPISSVSTQLHSSSNGMLLHMTSSFIIAPPVTFVNKSFRGAVGKCCDRHDQVGLKVAVEAVVVFGTVAVEAAEEMESVSTAKTADAVETAWCAVGIIWHSLETT